MSDAIVGTLAIAGALLVLLAGIGVLRFPDLYARMHAATKATTVGIALICIAGALAIDGGARRNPPRRRRDLHHRSQRGPLHRPRRLPR